MLTLLLGMCALHKMYVVTVTAIHLSTDFFRRYFSSFGYFLTSFVFGAFFWHFFEFESPSVIILRNFWCWSIFWWPYSHFWVNWRKLPSRVITRKNLNIFETFKKLWIFNNLKKIMSFEMFWAIEYLMSWG